MTRVYFACGAYIESLTPPPISVGERCLVFINDSTVSLQRPKIPEEALNAEKLPAGSVAHCLLMCPCTVKESGRKTDRGWFGEDVEAANNKPPCLYVMCKVKSIEGVK